MKGVYRAIGGLTGVTVIKKNTGLVNNITYLTRLLQNAKVMTTEKQGEAAEKVMSMRKNPLKNRLS